MNLKTEIACIKDQYATMAAVCLAALNERDPALAGFVEIEASIIELCVKDGHINPDHSCHIEMACVEHNVVVINVFDGVADSWVTIDPISGNIWEGT